MIGLSAEAQTTAPITSSGLNTHISSSQIAGGVLQHDIIGGTRAGANLFHSFGNFNIPANQIANFLNTPVNGSLPITANILGRVTGGNVSNIYGSIQTTGFGNANLFLMNPAGFLFGPNATVNVGGMVAFTSADYLRFADGARFNAASNAITDTLLSAAPVAAFGFLGSNPGAIMVQGSQITVSEGTGISLIGGNITLEKAKTDSGTTQATKLTAPGGQITLASLAGNGELSTSGDVSGLSTPANAVGTGTIQLLSGSVVQTSSSRGNAGPISIRGGQFVMENASLEANSSYQTANAFTGSTTQGDISIQVDSANLSNGSTITTSTSGAGKAGNIIFEVGSLRSNLGGDGEPLSNAWPVTFASNSNGQGTAGTIFIKGREGQRAETITLSNTKVIANATEATIPGPTSDGIEITAEKVVLLNGTVLSADTTGGADAGLITLNVGTLETRAGPDGRVLISSTSICAQGCAGGQAGDITIQGVLGVTPTVTKTYTSVVNPEGGPTEVFEYPLARNIDLHGTDIRSEAIGNAPGGAVIMRVQNQASFTDTHISVATQDFNINGNKPNGEFARNAGFSRIDIFANDVILKDSSIKADAEVSNLAACPTCTEGPSAGEIWLRVQNSLIADNSYITNTSRGRAQAGITKIIKDNFFSYGAVWEPDYPDPPTHLVKLTNSEITVEAQGTGFPGYLRIRADKVIMDHSILNSKVNDVSNGIEPNGETIDVVGAGERGRVLAHGRDVQGTILVSAKILDIIGGGIDAPTQGSRIGSRIELAADVVTTQQGNRPGGTLAAPRILNAQDPTRVVISTNSTGIGGAGSITIAGESVQAPEGTPLRPAASIRLSGTDVLTDTKSDALGGQIFLNSRGPVQLHNTTISSNVHDVRPQSANVTDQGGNIAVSAGNFSMLNSQISSRSNGNQDSGSIAITSQGSINAAAGSGISASNTGTGNAGDITVNSGGQFTLMNSSLTTEADQASGGVIKITTAPEGTVQLINSMISASVLNGAGGGGSVNIDPQYVLLQNSQILAQAVQGPGGNIFITTNLLLPDSNSTISASSQLGQHGSITIQSPIAPASGKIIPLSQQPLIPTALLGQPCAVQVAGEFSTFTLAGRDRLPIEPGSWLTDSIPSGITETLVASVPQSLTNTSDDVPSILSLRQISPAGLLTQAFAHETQVGCRS
ncbi:hypothetical protein W02_02570 [Nitrospira sp. KM1]|nr:hypothetical protein W02_02570 [Nitrospira sp. KM1]